MNFIHQPFFKRGLFLAAILFFVHSRVYAGQYFQDFSAFSAGATNFGDGSELFSDHLGTVAAVQDATQKELALTASDTTGTRSAFELPDLDSGAPVYAFSVKWNSQVYGNFPNAADGFSFNFGQLDSINPSLSSDTYAQEAGFGKGLSFGVQTYSGSNPGFYLRVNGAIYAVATNNPVIQWGANNPTRHFFEVDWNYTSGITVRVDGKTIFANVSTYGFTPNANDRFVWAARCGAFSEEVRLDNIVVVTGGNLQQVTTTSPYYADAGSPGIAFDGGINDNDWWVTTNMPCFIGATLSPSNNVLVYALTSGSPDRSQDPTDWTLEGSNNGSNWNSISAGGPGSFVNKGETRAWLAGSAPAYDAYRLNISQNNGGSATTLGELQFYTFKAFNPSWQKISSTGEMDTNDWISIAMSADGNIVLAASAQDYTWVYGYYGPSWARLDGTFSGSKTGWSSVVIADNKWAGTVSGGDIYRVPNASQGGPNWFSDNVGNYDWSAIASSSDGNKLAAAVNGDRIATSTDSVHFTFQPGSPAANWSELASSSDGSKLFAAGRFSQIYRSTNSGTNWTSITTSDLNWTSIACSADGSHLIACDYEFPDGGVFISADSGASWTKTSLSASSELYCAASSADGKTLIAGGADLYVSRDGGATWYQMTVTDQFQFWSAVACSADGSKLVLASAPVPASDNTSGIWLYDISMTAPVPAIVSQSVSGVTFTSASLNAQVNPNNLASAAWFQWGTTTSYGNIAAQQSIGNGTNPVGISASLTGLSAGTYHFRAVATNVIGTNFGADVSFTLRPTNAFFNVAIAGDTIIPTSANSPSGQGADKAIDGTASSKYLNFNIFNTGFTVFPAITNVPVQALGLISAEDSPERDPASFALYGSHDGTGFTLVASNSVPPFPTTNSIQSFGFANTNIYAAYKIIFPTVQNPNTANSMQIAEVELLPYGDITSTNDALNLQLPAGASLNGVGPTNSLLNRMIGGDADKIVVLNDTANVVAFITPAAGASIVKGVELIGGNDDASFPGREPSSFTLEGSKDGVTFTNLLSINPAAPTANMQIQGFSILGNTNAYKIYRATFGPPQSGNVLQIGELRLFGIASTKLNATAQTGHLLLSWPSADFVLQQSANLASPDWMPVTNDIIVTNGESRVMVTPSGNGQFFRLGSQ